MFSSYGQGMGSNRYMNWERLYNTDKNGYMQLLAPVEDEVFRRTAPVLKRVAQERGKRM